MSASGLSDVFLTLSGSGTPHSLSSPLELAGLMAEQITGGGGEVRGLTRGDVCASARDFACAYLLFMYALFVCVCVHVCVYGGEILQGIGLFIKPSVGCNIMTSLNSRNQN